MKAVIQRVSHASVAVENPEKHEYETIASIGQGYLVLLGIASEDTKETAERIVKKLTGLRIFADENGKTNLSIKDVNGAVLVVSQFTLYADCRKGNRPSFTNAGSPPLAEELYLYFTELCKKEIPHVEHGAFGAHMKVSLENNGPFTVILD